MTGRAHPPAWNTNGKLSSTGASAGGAKRQRETMARTQAPTSGAPSVSSSMSTVEIDDDTLESPDVAGCVRALVARWRFAPPAKAPVELSFPFVFQAGG